jgi:hypothetical protein
MCYSIQLLLKQTKLKKAQHLGLPTEGTLTPCHKFDLFSNNSALFSNNSALFSNNSALTIELLTYQVLKKTTPSFSSAWAKARDCKNTTKDRSNLLAAVRRDLSSAGDGLLHTALVIISSRLHAMQSSSIHCLQSNMPHSLSLIPNYQKQRSN